MSDQNDIRRDRDIREAATTAPDKLSDSTIMSASDYFLSGDYEPVEPVSFDVNLAGQGKPRRWVRFKFEPLDRDMIKEIRRDSTDDKGEEDGQLLNERLALQSLVDPDFSKPEMRRGFADPIDALRAGLRGKTGLIDQFGQTALSISGYAGDDMREVRAAGN